MIESNTIEFDEIKYIVTKDNESITLNPLSFKLLFALAQKSQEIVSNKSLMTSVWPNTAVSPETLKQRIFVLRKSLEQSTLKGVKIQAVRGEGYRLLIEKVTPQIEEPSTTEQSNNSSPNKISIINKKFLVILFIVISIIIVMFSYFALRPNNDKAISNNRLALWTNVPPNKMNEYASSIYQSWSHLLNQSNGEQRLQLIFSNKRQEFSLPVQARKDRVALISYFEVIKIKNDTTIKLSIIEPSTATILRTNIFSSSKNTLLDQTLESQLNGIQALISSQKLYLNKEQREYAKSPIWQDLKALANPP